MMMGMVESWAAQWVLNVIFGLAMAWIAARNRKMEVMEEELKAMASSLVKTEISLRTGELNGTLKVITAEIQSINTRLGRGDTDFERLGEARQKLELQTQAMIGDLKQWVVTNAASKEDLGSLSDRVMALQLAVARSEAAGAGGRKAVER